MKFSEFIAQWRSLMFRGRKPSRELVLAVFARYAFQAEISNDEFYANNIDMLERLFGYQITKEEFLTAVADETAKSQNPDS